MREANGDAGRRAKDVFGCGDESPAKCSSTARHFVSLEVLHVDLKCARQDALRRLPNTNGATSKLLH